MEQETGNKKRFNITAIILLLFVICLVLLPVVKTFYSPGKFIILDSGDNYFLARSLYICGKTVVYSGSSFTDKSREKVLEDDTEIFSFTVQSLNEIKLIEIIPDAQPDAKPETEYPPEYLGRYKINVQGHEGTLVLWNKDGKIYGTMKFRTWGTGAVEYLKGIRISGKNIYFTRSASTDAEAARLGANNTFWQKFSGTYSLSGRKISGYFINDRKEKYQWKAER